MKLWGSIAAALLSALAGSVVAEERRQVVLSYDDAPTADGALFTGAERAETLIAGLARAEAGPAVFFVTTGPFDADPAARARIARYAAAGHLVANHTHSHPWAHEIDAEA